MAMQGLCIVVTPLIALMKDQVEALRSKNIPALMLNSTMTHKEVNTVLQLAVSDKCKFLYLSPERLQTNLFAQYLPAINVCLIAVDEAHCISQWGYDFRPPYLQIASLRNEKPNAPILAVTASATAMVQADIIEKLTLSNVKIFKKNFERPNVSYSAYNEPDKLTKIQAILAAVQGTAIIYCSSRKATQLLSAQLIQLGYSSSHYHAGLTSEQRSILQQNWMQGNTRIMVCTNAFGMGIDKPNVRLVIHYTPPDSIESYYQEAGRAGRDEQKAYAVLLYNEADIALLQTKPETKYPPIDTLKNIYLSISNYLQVAAGAGYNESYTFDLASFCTTLQLQATTVINSLGILCNHALLQYSTDNAYQQSTVFISATRDGLTQYDSTNINLANLIKTLLRNYQGIRDVTTTISEKNLAYLLHTDIAIVQNQLLQLHQHGVLIYQAANHNTQITYLQPRFAAKDFAIDIALYTRLKKNYIYKVSQIISYLSNTTLCRSVSISNYFNSEHKSNCGVCDNCVNANRQKANTAQLLALKNKVVAQLNTTPQITINTLQVGLNKHAATQLQQVINQLITEEIIVIENNHLTLVKK